MLLTTKYLLYSPKFKQNNAGFSLVEIAVVLVIVGLLLGSILGPLSTQRQNSQIKTTNKTLQEIHDALLGFAAINGYFPCPATNTSNGLEARSGANCTTEHGFIPAVTLAITGSLDTQKRLLDEWLQPYRYSLNNVNNWEFSKTLSVTGSASSFKICDQSSCPANSEIALAPIAVIYSTGITGAQGARSNLETENTNTDDNFVTALESQANGSEFDDLLTWISANTLALTLVKSGQAN